MDNVLFFLFLYIFNYRAVFPWQNFWCIDGVYVEYIGRVCLTARGNLQPLAVCDAIGWHNMRVLSCHLKVDTVTAFLCQPLWCPSPKVTWHPSSDSHIPGPSAWVTPEMGVSVYPSISQNPNRWGHSCVSPSSVFGCRIRAECWAEWGLCGRG